MTLSRELLVNIDVRSAQAMAATSAYGKANDRLEAQLVRASKAQEKLDAAIAASGAGSKEATAAQAGYERQLGMVAAAQDRAAIAAQRSADIQAAAAKRLAAEQEAASTKQAAALKRVGTVAGGIGAVAAISLGLAAKAAADFDAKLAQLQALTRGSPAEISALAAQAHGYTNLGFSASDAADAEIELVKAGIPLKDILGGALTGTVNLAAAGQLDLASATSISAQAMTQFQLSGSDVPHIADLLAAGADRALGSVQDLGEGLKYSGLLAHQAGMSIDETVAALSEFAQAGLIGSQGGTTLQQVLRQLLGPTDKAKAEIQSLGLQLYDAQGNFVGLASVAGQLHDKLGGMSQAQRNVALNTIFTSRAVRGATILYQDGARGVEYWQKQVEASGFAADQARGKMNSLSGDLQKLGAVVQNDLIDVGQQLQPVLRTITQSLVSVGDALAALPDPVKSVGVEFGVAVAALGLGFWAFTRIKGAAISLAESLGILARAQTGVAATAGTMAVSEDVATAAMTREAASTGLLGRLDKAGLGRVGLGLGAALGASILGQVGHGKSGASTFAGIGSDALYGAALGSFFPGPGTVIGGGVGALYGAYTHPQVKADTRLGYGYSTAGAFSGGGLPGDPRFPGAKAYGAGMSALQAHPFTVSAAQSVKVLDQLGIAGVQTSRMLDGVGKSAKDAQSGISGMGSAALSGARGVDAFGKSLDNLLSPKLNLSAATDQWVSGLRGLSGSLAKNSKTLDGNSAAALQNRDAIRTQVTNMEAVLKAQAAAGVSAHQLSGHLVEMRQRLIDAGAAAGISKAQMTAYLQVLGLTPKLVATIVKNNAPQAEQDIWSYRHAIDAVPGYKQTVITAKTEQAESAMLRLVGLEGEIRSKDVFINVNTQYTHSGVQATPSATGGPVTHGFNFIRRAGGGGTIVGPGSSMSDTAGLYALSNGEFVEPVRSVNYYGPRMMEDIRTLRMPRLPQYLATGGSASQSPPGPLSSGSQGGDVAQEVRALRTELAHLRRRFDAPISTKVTNPKDIGRAAQGIATYQAAQDASFQTDLLEMGP